MKNETYFSTKKQYLLITFIFQIDQSLMSDDLSAKGECIGGNNDERASSTNNQTSSDNYSKFS